MTSSLDLIILCFYFIQIEMNHARDVEENYCIFYLQCTLPISWNISVLMKFLYGHKENDLYELH